jgi:hypothetical protein
MILTLFYQQKHLKTKKQRLSSLLFVPQTVTVSNFLIRDFERVKDFYLTYEQIILDVLGEDDYITIEDYI